MTRRRTWVSIVIAALMIAGIFVATFLGGTYVFMRSHVHPEDNVGEGAAQARFEQARGRFAGQAPLITISADGDAALRRDRTGERKPVEVLHAMTYDPAEEHLTRVDIPGWLLRALSVGGRVRLANLGFGDDTGDQQLRLEDLERHGPGLVMDVTVQGRKLLVWTE